MNWVGHVTPINDAIEHDEAPTCWCQPTRIELHDNADGRELLEPGARYPPATRQ